MSASRRALLAARRTTRPTYVSATALSFRASLRATASRPRLAAGVACFLVAAMGGAAPVGAQGDLDLMQQLEALEALEKEMEQEETFEASEGHQAMEEALSADRAAASERKKNEEMLRRRLQEQIDFQADLMNKSGKIAELPSAEAVLREADPRAAPRPPEERDLPVSIFDTEETSIPPGEWGNSSRIKVVVLTLDADNDGNPEIVRWVDRESKLRIRQEGDRNYDGVTDSWSEYEWGEIVSRVLDSNDDGNPDVWERYAKGRMTSREIDRDDDGVRDAFYKYEGDSLVEERHDSNNDRQIDLVILYKDRLRTSAEEDQDRDGSMDTWTTYIAKSGQEIVARIERDKRGEGAITTVEVFDTESGEPIIARKDEDVNGDGEVDVVSIYREGKLVRREIADPELVEL